MIRAYLIYGLMAVLLVGGLWAILGVGRTLHAVHDISGDWRVEWNADATTMPTHAREAKLHIEQSGRFCTLRFDDGLQVGMKVVDGTFIGRSTEAGLLAVLDGGTHRLTVRSGVSAGDYDIEWTRGTDHAIHGRMMRPQKETAVAANSHGATIVPPALVAEASDARSR